MYNLGMKAQRAIAFVVLVALVGALGLPWIGADHQFNDDPHWAVAYGADHGEGPAWDAGQPGNESHCEVCHWLRTMRSASRPAQITLFHDVRQVVPPTSLDPRTHAARLRALSARAPPTTL
jgi:hypothetical protein